MSVVLAVGGGRRLDRENRMPPRSRARRASPWPRGRDRACCQSGRVLRPDDAAGWRGLDWIWLGRAGECRFGHTFMKFNGSYRSGWCSDADDCSVGPKASCSVAGFLRRGCLGLAGGSGAKLKIASVPSVAQCRHVSISSGHALAGSGFSRRYGLLLHMVSLQWLKNLPLSWARSARDSALKSLPEVVEPCRCG